MSERSAADEARIEDLTCVITDAASAGSGVTTEELGELVAHLVGPHGGFTTGATYNLNGGLRVG